MHYGPHTDRDEGKREDDGCGDKLVDRQDTNHDHLEEHKSEHELMEEARPERAAGALSRQRREHVGQLIGISDVGTNKVASAKKGHKWRYHREH